MKIFGNKFSKMGFVRECSFKNWKNQPLFRLCSKFLNLFGINWKIQNFYVEKKILNTYAHSENTALRKKVLSIFENSVVISERLWKMNNKKWNWAMKYVFRYFHPRIIYPNVKSFWLPELDISVTFETEFVKYK